MNSLPFLRIVADALNMLTTLLFLFLVLFLVLVLVLELVLYAAH